MNAPMCSTVQLLIELSKNPILIKRKAEIYMNKELKKYKVTHESELNPE